MNDIVLFAGTTEGRRIAEGIRGMPVNLHVSVATEYGETLIEPSPNISVETGRKNASEIAELLRHTGAGLVIDATHPYAREITETLQSICQMQGIEYLRILRDSSLPEPEICAFVENTNAAVDFLNEVRGNILLTVGSKELAAYTRVTDYKKRVFARILPLPETTQTAFSLGFTGSRLICMQGPFSEDLNTAMLWSLNIRYLVTKDTGTEGGFPEKIRAAKTCGVTPVVIKRPLCERGISVEECLERLEKRYGFSSQGQRLHTLPGDPANKAVFLNTSEKDDIQEAASHTPGNGFLFSKAGDKQITILGIGPGGEGALTLDAAAACQNADLIIGSKRVCESLARFGKPTACAVTAEELEKLIRNSKAKTIVAAMSGDSGFYSGTKSLLSRIADLHPALLPGISSVSYFCSRIGISLDDAVLVSLHGRSCNLVAKIRRNPKVIALVGGADGVRNLTEALTENGLGSVSLTIGENLSYENEKITVGSAEELCQREFDALAVVLVQNPPAEQTVVTHGRPDEAFSRTNIPMTKQEVRSVVLSKLRLTKNAVCWDVGAGTGSVSLEMAECCEDGEVFAIEQKKEACELIETNKKRLGVTNVRIVHGAAPDCLSELPAPTHVFIGGSGGKLSSILDTILQKNPAARIVLSAVTLETLAKAAEILKTLPVRDVEIVQLAVSRSQSIGQYHLMTAQNPVFIFSFRGV